MSYLTETVSKKRLEQKMQSTPLGLPKLPTQNLTKKELAEHRRIIARMKRGEEFSHSEVFGK